MIFQVVSKSVVKCRRHRWQNIFSPSQWYAKQFVTIPVAANIKFLPETALQEFASSYKDIRNDIINNQLVTHLPDVNNKLQTILDYNVPTGRKIRASLIIATYQLMTNKKNLSIEETKNLYILAWSYEIMVSAYIIQDDIVDNSIQRRGKPCWHQCVGMSAINDSIVIEAAAEKLIKKYFTDHKNYHKMLEVLMDMRSVSRVGQILETSTTTLHQFTVEKYHEIASHKMGHCTFEVPIMLSALLAAKENMMYNPEVLKILRELGLLYSIMNDYLDCYGEEYFRKLGTDIQEKRCTWLIIQALQKADKRQRKILEENYGSYDEEKLWRVKQIYEELEIHQTYEVAEKKIHEKIICLLKNVEDKEARYLLNELTKIVFRTSSSAEENK